MNSAEAEKKKKSKKNKKRQHIKHRASNNVNVAFFWRTKNFGPAKKKTTSSASERLVVRVGIRLVLAAGGVGVGGEVDGAPRHGGREHQDQPHAAER